MEHGEVAELEGGVSRDDMRGAISALAVLTALLLLAGLVSAVVVDRRADDDVSIAALQRAAARVEDARSLHLEMDADFGGGGFGMVADIDNVTGRARMSFGERGGHQTEALYDGARLYFRVPDPQRANTGGKPCVVVDAPADGATVPAPGDGTAMLEHLAGATGEVGALGAEDLDGVATQKYRVDVDVAEVVDRLPAGQRQGAAGLSGMTGLATIPYEVWLDEDDVVRQVRVVFEFGDVRATSTARFDPSDEPVVVEVPPAGACATAPDAAAVFPMLGVG